MFLRSHISTSAPEDPIPSPLTWPFNVTGKTQELIEVPAACRKHENQGFGGID